MPGNGWDGSTVVLVLYWLIVRVCHCPEMVCSHRTYKQCVYGKTVIISFFPNEKGQRNKIFAKTPYEEVNSQGSVPSRAPKNPEHPKLSVFIILGFWGERLLLWIQVLPDICPDVAPFSVLHCNLEALIMTASFPRDHSNAVSTTESSTDQLGRRMNVCLLWKPFTWNVASLSWCTVAQ